MNILLVDGYNIFSRAIKSFSYSKNVEGKQNSGIYGFFEYILRATKLVNFDKIHIIFDGGGHSAFREGLDKNYKCTRKKVDTFNAYFRNTKNEEFEHLLNLLDEVNIPYYRFMNVEADDIISYFINNNKNDVMYILSSDSDFYQLLDKNVNIIIPITKGGLKIFTYDDFINKYKFIPRKYAVLKSLMGDQTDNVQRIIPKGIGLKTVIKKLMDIPDNYNNDDILNLPIFSTVNKDAFNLNYELINLFKNRLSMQVIDKIKYIENNKKDINKSKYMLSLKLKEKVNIDDIINKFN